MANKAKHLPPIPAKRYFDLEELCYLADIRPEQFYQWQQDNGIVIGRGGNQYTRQDVVKLRQLSGSFPAYVDRFNLNGSDRLGRPAATADEVRADLQSLLGKIEAALAKPQKTA
ncbi:hypothetical protein H9Q10_08975 [Eikenella sp. S3360]|uniref:MerR family transcriptional regulator n=1 Tax=Eikenella glucosivorans TaxID=2766967 RepID=A0ABS0NC18_9NEIS|nr:hypothetical protein [Eikenella glucosivorans]MBH5329799.1 hypothetical protein [Eikenella glucosivorans]